MKKFKINKNKHYPFPYIPTPLPIYVKDYAPTYISKAIVFTDSCLYDLIDEDQYDINKLFGFSIGLHHNNSFRFGWRPNLKTNEIEIFSYEYGQGKRINPHFITNVKINNWNSFYMYYCPKEETILYLVNKDLYKHNVKLTKKGGWGYSLGFYFGGNEKAPQDVIVYKE